jgi:phosphoribosylanthranilate isomerase
MILKICGITNQEDATAAVEGGANAIGFNFHPPSPRYIAPEHAGEIGTPAGVRRVGVFVNEARGRVEEVARIAALTVAQLHGDEAPAEYPAGLAVWKGVRVTEGFDLSRYDECPAEALLLDGPAGEMFGGAGKSFDWSVAGEPDEGVRRGPGGPPHKSIRIILAGGLDGSNVARAIALAHPWGVDACSRIESAPGKKDLRKMRAFLEAAGAALGA